MNKLLKSYLIDVETPGASGIEHLDMLQRRSELAEIEPQLTSTERQALDAADQLLVQYATEFLAEISEITDLAEERREQDPSVSEWWWYLDVLIHAPVASVEANAYVVAERRTPYGKSET